VIIQYCKQQLPNNYDTGKTYGIRYSAAITFLSERSFEYIYCTKYDSYNFCAAKVVRSAVLEKCRSSVRSHLPPMTQQDDNG